MKQVLLIFGSIVEAKTISDILMWTEHYHKQLATSFNRCANPADQQRISMLIVYLEEHEENLATALDTILELQDEEVLNDWCSEYTLKQPLFSKHIRLDDLSKLTTEEISVKVITAHQQIIAMYRGLMELADRPKISEVLHDLIELEESELTRTVMNTHH